MIRLLSLLLLTLSAGAFADEAKPFCRNWLDRDLVPSCLRKTDFNFGGLFYIVCDQGEHVGCYYAKDNGSTQSGYSHIPDDLRSEYVRQTYCRGSGCPTKPARPSSGFAEWLGLE